MELFNLIHGCVRPGCAEEEGLEAHTKASTIKSGWTVVGAGPKPLSGGVLGQNHAGSDQRSPSRQV